MNAKQALYDRLRTYAGLTALVGDRIFPANAGQGISTPYITYQKISPGRQYAMGGYVGMQKTRFQISCFADLPEDNELVAEQVIAALESWPNVAVYQDGEGDAYEQSTEKYHIPLDFIIWYQG